MRLIVQKYGGSIFSTIEDIKEAANKIKKFKLAGYQLVVVVSAMKNMTENLSSYATQISEYPDSREYAALLSVGEQVSSSLLAIALNDIGVKAISLSARQVGLQTNDRFESAEIISINKRRIQKHLAVGDVVIVAGFQGVDENDNTTLLGRGGSDISAVFLSEKLNAFECQFYKDVNGVFQADPKIIKSSIKYSELSYADMLKLSKLGSKLLNPKAVELAQIAGVRLRVLPLKSSYPINSGTLISKDKCNIDAKYLGIIPVEEEYLFKIKKGIEVTDAVNDLLLINLGSQRITFDRDDCHCFLLNKEDLFLFRDCLRGYKFERVSRLTIAGVSKDMVDLFLKKIRIVLTSTIKKDFYLWLSDTEIHLIVAKTNFSEIIDRIYSKLQNCEDFTEKLYA